MPFARRARLVVLAYKAINAMADFPPQLSDREILEALAASALAEASKAQGPDVPKPSAKQDMNQFLAWRQRNGYRPPDEGQ